MPYIEELLTSNQRLHRRPEHEITRQLRADAAKTVPLERLPRLQRAAIFHVLHPRPINRKRDPDNWAPSEDLRRRAGDPEPEPAGGAPLVPGRRPRGLLGPNPVMGPALTTGFARRPLVIVELLDPLTSEKAGTLTGVPTST